MIFLLPRALLIYLFVAIFFLCVAIIACCGVVTLQNVVPILGCYSARTTPGLASTTPVTNVDFW
jgi:regulator of protease activity HflC (stomatin/prohibitin superfamily)